MEVGELAMKVPVTIPADATVAQAALLMDAKAVGALLVIDDEHHDRLVGIVTDRDIVTRGVARGAPLDGRIDSVMTTDVVTLDPETDVREAYKVLRHHALRRMPLVRGDRAVGMVTVDDLLIVLATDLSDLIRPVVGEAVFGHPEPRPPDRATAV